MSETSRALRRPDLPAGDVGAALAAVGEFSSAAAMLGRDSAVYFDTLRALGAFDLTTARVVEPHLDALAILAEAGVSPGEALRGGCGDGGADGGNGVVGGDRRTAEGGVVGGGDPAGDRAWGVFAARAPGLRAREESGGWVLDGVKPWCSLGEQLSHALVTAGTDEGQRLFAVDLDDARVQGSDEPWVSRGLAAIRSTSLTFDAMPATPIGGPGFYLGRDGFAWGGIGVAAVWAGGVDGLVEAVRAAARRREPDQIALMHLGRLEMFTSTLDAVLADAARAIDDGKACGSAGLALSSRVRAIVADLVERALTVAGHALGPGPLTADEAYARRVADLGVYVRQHHAERDLAAIGAASLERE